MFVNPVELIEKGLVRGLFNHDKQIQPNAIDFTVDAINEIVRNETNGLAGDYFYIGESRKKMAKQVKLEPAHSDVDPSYWTLEANSEYDIYSNVYVEVPEGYAAILLLRSTFVRNGLWLASGLYDSGFKGNIGAVLHTGNQRGFLEVGTRIGQIAFVESGTAKLYAGGYNTAEGVHWTEKQ